MINIAILVLAAGKSSRMNRPKQLVKIGNNFLLETVLSKAKAINRNHVYCVLGANSDVIRQEISCPNINYIYNTDFDSGISSSIKTGISLIKRNNKQYNGVLILLGDQPAIEKSYLADMIQRFNEDTSKIITSNYNNKLGVPAVFSESYFTVLEKLNGDFGAKEILKNNRDVISMTKQTNFIDIDTEKDLQDFKKSILK